jgi:hypothetical protein
MKLIKIEPTDGAITLQLSGANFTLLQTRVDSLRLAVTELAKSADEAQLEAAAAALAGLVGANTFEE